MKKWIAFTMALAMSLTLVGCGDREKDPVQDDRIMQIEGLFLLSYNDDDFVRELYKDFKIEAVERGNNLAGGKFKELIIMNY